MAVPSGSGSYVVHPAILDGAFQTVAAILPAADGEAAYLPSGVGAVEVDHFTGFVVGRTMVFDPFIPVAVGMEFSVRGEATVGVGVGTGLGSLDPQAASTMHATGAAKFFSLVKRSIL